MAIKVEAHTQAIKSQTIDLSIMEFGSNLVLVMQHPEKRGKLIAVHLTGTYAGMTVSNFKTEGCISSKKSVTIQNVTE